MQPTLLDLRGRVIPNLRAKLKVYNKPINRLNIIQTSNVKVMAKKALLRKTATLASTLLEEVMAAEEEDVVQPVVEEEEAVVARATPHRSSMALNLNLKLNPKLKNHSPLIHKPHRPKHSNPNRNKQINRQINNRSLPRQSLKVS